MVTDVIQALHGCQRIVITTHIRPDGDAIGSQLALALFLRKLGKQVEMINTDGVPDTLEWMEGAETIAVFEGTFEQRYALAHAETIIVVDLNALHRLGPVLSDLVRESEAVKVLIDHHCRPEPWHDVALIRDSAAASGELVYELIQAWDSGLLRGPIATALYVAILTDTGMFRYDTVTPSVHRMVADLLERGSRSPNQVYAAIYETRDRRWPRLLGHVMKTLVLRYGDKLAYIVIRQRVLEALSATSEDTEGFVDFAMAVDGVEVALVFLETSKGIKVSFRSKGSHRVDSWARSFGGGGHRNASGAFFSRPLHDVIELVVTSAPKHTGLLQAGVLSPEDRVYLSMLKSS